ncbi:hypothetical protein LOAG_15433 [Loa loa]|uniref:Uncharacterized protein n=1 Tax=Loa loa TaxID=7209 RepID=A0A1S0TFQ7_LOALO|nr:hypothetical protein LOAG_15433 [Loa loa]EFO13098.1 hypothetical protein LOAG_15433 [Loa loa]
MSHACMVHCADVHVKYMTYLYLTQVFVTLNERTWCACGPHVRDVLVFDALVSGARVGTLCQKHVCHIHHLDYRELTAIDSNECEMSARRKNNKIEKRFFTSELKTGDQECSL